MRSIDLNSDMGEGFGPWTIGDGVDDQIMPLISSANIATGFHAGDPSIMSHTAKIAAQHGVSIGAHPGFRDLVGFGRRHMNANSEELVNDIMYQIGAMREIARVHNLSLQHVKPHGALYMHAAKNTELAEMLVTQLHAVSPQLLLYVMHGSAIHKAALQIGQPVVCEFYADRDYDLSGSIVFTRRVNPLDPIKVANKVLKACQEGKVQTLEGEEIDISFESVCIHSDTPGALDLIKATRDLLDKSDISIRSPSQ
ncbi:MAG: 5-oxoprolinase subunit PxpA [Marinomonas sp.]